MNVGSQISVSFPPLSLQVNQYESALEIPTCRAYIHIIKVCGDKIAAKRNFQYLRFFKNNLVCKYNKVHVHLLMSVCAKSTYMKVQIPYVYWIILQLWPVYKLYKQV